MNESLIQITTRVGSGNAAPRPSKSDANVGITFHKMTPTTNTVMTMIAAGYVSAAFTCPLSLTLFSIKPAAIIVSPTLTICVTI